MARMAEQVGGQEPAQGPLELAAVARMAEQVGGQEPALGPPARAAVEAEAPPALHWNSLSPEPSARRTSER